MAARSKHQTRVIGARVLAQVARALAAAGWPDEAENAARSITNSGDQARALAEVAETLAAAGLPDQARRAAIAAESAAGLSDHHQREVSTQIARALAATGQSSQAVAIARSLTSSGDRARALAQVAEHWRPLDCSIKPKQLLGPSLTPAIRARALTYNARALAAAGLPDQARHAASKAEAAARSVTRLGDQGVGADASRQGPGRRWAVKRCGGGCSVHH